MFQLIFGRPFARLDIHLLLVLAFVTLMILLVLLLPEPAAAAAILAAAGPPHGVNLSPLFGYLNETLALLGTGIAAYVVMLVRSWLASHLTFLDAKTDATLATGLNTALQNGVNIAMQKLGAFETVHENINLKNSVAAAAANYAISHAPDAVDRFGLTPDALATKALAFLPQPAPLLPMIAGVEAIKTA